MAVNRASVLVDISGDDSNLKQSILSAEAKLSDFASAARIAAEKASVGFKQVNSGISSIKESLENVTKGFLGFIGIEIGLEKLHQIAELSEQWEILRRKIELVTTDSESFRQAEDGIINVAQELGMSISDITSLYIRLQKSLRLTNVEQSDVIKITEELAKIFRISGSSIEEANQTISMLALGFTQGTLKGRQLNSIMREMPALAQAIADGLGVPITQLKSLGDEGKLTSQVVANALLKMSDNIDTSFNKIPLTIGQAFTKLKNTFQVWIHDVDESYKATEKFTEAIIYLSDNFDKILSVLKQLIDVGLTVLAYRLIPTIIKGFEVLKTTIVSFGSAAVYAINIVALSITDAITILGKWQFGFVLLSTFLVGWKIGEWLSEKFDVVRKAGVAMIESLVKGFEYARYAWEVFAAVFTNDTIGEATKRHEKRLQDMNIILNAMYNSAENGTKSAEKAMETAGNTAEGVNKKLNIIRQSTQDAINKGIEEVDKVLEALKSRIGVVDQAIKNTQSIIDGYINKIAESYKGLTGTIENDIQKQINAVKNRYEQEKKELEIAKNNEIEKITKTTELLSEALKRQTQLREEASKENIRLIEEEGRIRIEVAKEQGATDEERKNNITRIENEILAAKRQVLTQSLAEYKQYIDALNAEANRNLAEIQRIEEVKRQLTMTTEERIREIRRSGLSEYEQIEDKKKQILEYQAEARKALSNGEIEHAKQLAQKSLDLAANVASEETSINKRASDERTNIEKEYSKAIELEANARKAMRKGEIEHANDLMRQAAESRENATKKEIELDQLLKQSKSGITEAIDNIYKAESILKDALNEESEAHKIAADNALAARENIKNVLNDTSTQIDNINIKLKEGFKLLIDADTVKAQQAIKDIEKLITEKEYLLKVQADLNDAKSELEKYEKLLSEGKTLPVGADTTKAKEALDKIKKYAEDNAIVDLKVSTENAISSIETVQSKILKLNDIQTQSNHTIESNVDSVRSEIMSLNGMNTSSTHTIYIQKVETNALGGLVGMYNVKGYKIGGAVTPGILRYAIGGPVFEKLTQGVVPGTGLGDTVPRMLQAGSYVIRKDAVRKYGFDNLQRVSRFANGGYALLNNNNIQAEEENKERLKYNIFIKDERNKKQLEDFLNKEFNFDNFRHNLPDFKLFEDYFNHTPLFPKLNRTVTSTMLDAIKKIRVAKIEQANFNVPTEIQHLDDIIEGLDTLKLMLFADPLTSEMTQKINEIAKINPFVSYEYTGTGEPGFVSGFDKDKMKENEDRNLIDFLVQYQDEVYAKGGIKKTDTIPALLTPGEYVVNKKAVEKYGVSLFNAINNMQVDRSIFDRLKGYSEGGIVDPLNISYNTTNISTTPSKTIRLELSIGGNSVYASMAENDESKLLQMISSAKKRSI